MGSSAQNVGCFRQQHRAVEPCAALWKALEAAEAVARRTPGSHAALWKQRRKPEAGSCKAVEAASAFSNCEVTARLSVKASSRA